MATGPVTAGGGNAISSILIVKVLSVRMFLRMLSGRMLLVRKPSVRILADRLSVCHRSEYWRIDCQFAIGQNAGSLNVVRQNTTM